MSSARRRLLVNTQQRNLSIRRQCCLLGLSRSSVYYRKKAGDSLLNQTLRGTMEQLFLEYPFYGSRQMCRALQRQGYTVNRKRVRRLMCEMGLVPIYQHPKTTIPNPAHEKYPYLLRNVTVQNCNQVWCTDITYIPMRRGFLYLVAIMDWHSRAVLAWRLSNVMDTEFCVAALNEALARYGKPEIFNTDQGSQFTSTAFTDVLHKAGIRISMDGRGRCKDNIFIERLWRSLKYENIYVNAYDNGREAQAGIASWITFYNHARPHSSLGGRSPLDYFIAEVA